MAITDCKAVNCDRVTCCFDVDSKIIFDCRLHVSFLASIKNVTWHSLWRHFRR